MRRLWPDVLAKVEQLRRFTWIMLSQNAQVVGVDDGTVTIGLVNSGARDSFLNSKSDEVLQRALSDVLGVQWRVDAVIDPGATPGAGVPEPAAAAPAAPPVERPRGVTAPPEVHQALQQAPAEAPTAADIDASASLNDPELETENLDPEALLSRELGAEVIEEIPSDQ
ncbi:hypothetical protein E0W78_13315 [Aeromicrobium sp. IC_218]|nr:hypothetical protein E0W78_13315 [Aeromicrobium sp. IC_218]